MNKFDRNTWTYGAEIEWGDVDRNLILPPELGSWEYSETDVININPGPYQFVACDPLGTTPSMGGEINMIPTHTTAKQVENIMMLLKWFRGQGNDPTPSSVSHLHIHVRIPGLRDDIDALHRLAKYIRDSQEIVIPFVSRYYDHPSFKKFPGALSYYKYDGGRRVPQWMSNNMMKAKDFDDFIKMHAAGKDGVSMGRPFRYAINTYCMKHIDTIEFRMFRASIDYSQIKTCFDFVQSFMNAALNTGEDISEILFGYEKTHFPPMIFRDAEYIGWQKTKHPKERGKKVRTFHDI